MRGINLKLKNMKELNYLFLSLVIFSIIACGGEEDTSKTTKDIGSTNDEIEELEKTVAEEEVYEDEDGGDWEPPGGDMERYMDLKEEGFSHEEAVEIMEEE